MTDLQNLCKSAHEARITMGTLDTDLKNKVLKAAADSLMAAEKEILDANAVDVANAKEKLMAEALIDRLTLNHERLEGMADGLRQIAKLADPI